MHFADIYSWDRLGDNQSSVHRLDPRAKVIVTFFFIFAVMSFDKYTVAALLPFLLFPVSQVIIADLPLGTLLKRLVLISPFAVLVGIFNPFIDRQVITSIGSVQLTGGWVSFTSIIIRFFLTAGAALILLSTTGIYRLCLGLRKMGIPRVFVVQLLLLYRYIFVFLDDASRLLFARSARSFGRRGLGIRTYCYMIGGFMIRSIDRALRIYNAMKSRGFTGEIHLSGSIRWRASDSLFVFGWCVLITLMRLYNLPACITQFLNRNVL